MPSRRTHSHCLSICRPVLPHAINVIIQTRIAALSTSFDDDSAVAESRAEKGVSIAFVKTPFWSETTMNCAPQDRVRNNVAMCCLYKTSSTASILSRMYIGEGLNCSSDMISDGAMSDLYAPRTCCRP